MSDVTRIAVVGAGIRGQMYARVVMEHPDSDLVGFCETSSGTAAKVEAEFRVPVFDNLSELLNAVDHLDGVIIATPDFAHRDAGVTALHEGLHVLFEKPLATTLSDSRALAEAAADPGKVMLGFENRWHPKFHAVRELLRGSAQPFIAQRALLQDTHWVPREMLPWAAQSTPGWFLMPHSLDMAMWLSGARPVEVFARGVRKVLVADGLDTWDRITATFKMSDDSIVTLDSGWALPVSRPSVFEFRFEIETSTEQFEIDIDRSGISRFSADGATFVDLANVDNRGRLQGPAIDMARDFVDLCQGADIDVPTLHDGMVNTAAITALHDSLATNTNRTIEY